VCVCAFFFCVLQGAQLLDVMVERVQSVNGSAAFVPRPNWECLEEAKAAVGAWFRLVDRARVVAVVYRSGQSGGQVGGQSGGQSGGDE